MSGFSFAGAKKLEDVIKLDLIQDKSKAEVSDIWLTYHEEKERVHGDILSGKDGLSILDRAEKKYVLKYIYILIHFHYYYYYYENLYLMRQK